MTIDLDKLEARALLASQGEWRHKQVTNGLGEINYDVVVRGVDETPLAYDSDLGWADFLEPDAAYIAAAQPTVVLELIGEARERVRLQGRVDELLVAIRRISADTPYPEEFGNAAALIAEVGTLRSQLRESRGELREAFALLDEDMPDEYYIRVRQLRERASAAGVPDGLDALRERYAKQKRDAAETDKTKSRAE